MTSYFDLQPTAQQDILTAGAQKLDMTARVLEKDLWVCWVLESLFTMPKLHPAAFKGGTSLSKCFQAIERFSEDVDITLDYTKFEVAGYDIAPDYCSHGLSTTAIKKYSDKLRDAVSDYIKTVVTPYLKDCASKLPDKLAEQVVVEIDSGNAENILINYPSVVEGQVDDYIKDRVLLEFGGRNVIKPNGAHKITPYVAEVAQKLDFPVANDVVVISAERTFWEKVTLIHVACNKPKTPSTRERQSRHWYDIYRLYKHEAGLAALENTELLQDVIHLKDFFYKYSYANYDACLTGGCKLVPEGDLLIIIRDDYSEMLKAGFMHGDDQPTFDQLIANIQEIENMINKKGGSEEE